MLKDGSSNPLDVRLCMDVFVNERILMERMYKILTKGLLKSLQKCSISSTHGSSVQHSADHQSRPDQTMEQASGKQAARHHASGTRPGFVTQHSIKSVLGSPSKVSHCWCKGLVSEPNSKGLKAGKKLPVKPNVCARVKTTVPETSEPSMREVGYK